MFPACLDNESKGRNVLLRKKEGTKINNMFLADAIGKKAIIVSNCVPKSSDEASK